MLCCCHCHALSSVICSRSSLPSTWSSFLLVFLPNGSISYLSNSLFQPFLLRLFLNDPIRLLDCLTEAVFQPVPDLSIFLLLLCHLPPTHYSHRIPRQILFPLSLFLFLSPGPSSISFTHSHIRLHSATFILLCIFDRSAAAAATTVCLVCQSFVCHSLPDGALVFFFSLIFGFLLARLLYSIVYPIFLSSPFTLSFSPPAFRNRFDTFGWAQGQV